MKIFHLAQVNIAKMRAPSDDPIMADFMNNLERVNTLAERSEGFVWRLNDEQHNAISIKVFDQFSFEVARLEEIFH